MARKKKETLPELVPQVFEHEEFGEIRFIQKDGEIWFVAVDVCRALDIQNTTQAVARLDDDERAILNIGRSPIHGGGGETNFINEPGLYRLIFASNKPEAKKFKRWVCHEVLPSIRKYGYYTSPNQKVIRIVGDKEFKAFKAQYPEGSVEVKGLIFDLDEYDNGDYDVITIREVVVHSDKLIANRDVKKLV